MKLLSVLVLCGVACCFAQPRCDPDEESKCRSIYSFSKVPETEEELDASCRATKCLLDYYSLSRCQSDDVNPTVIKQGEAFYDSLCSRTSSELRKKYLANARCISEAVELILNDPKFPIDLSDTNDQPLCKVATVIVKRFRDFFVKTCNEDAAEVFENIFKKVLDC